MSDINRLKNKNTSQNSIKTSYVSQKITSPTFSTVTWKPIIRFW